MPIYLKNLSDHTGAESGSNKPWSMSYLLPLFLGKIVPPIGDVRHGNGRQSY